MTEKFKYVLARNIYQAVPKVYCKECRGAKESPFKGCFGNRLACGTAHVTMVNGKKVTFYRVDLSVHFPKAGRTFIIYFYVSDDEETKELVSNVDKFLKDWAPEEYEITYHYDIKTGSPSK